MSKLDSCWPLCYPRKTSSTVSKYEDQTGGIQVPANLPTRCRINFFNIPVRVAYQGYVIMDIAYCKAFDHQEAERGMARNDQVQTIRPSATPLVAAAAAASWETPES